MKKEVKSDPAGDMLASLELTLKMRTSDLVEIPQVERGHLKMALITTRWEDARDMGVGKEAEEMISAYFKSQDGMRPSASG